VVLQNEMFVFMLACNSSWLNLLASVQMTIVDANGHTVFSMTSYAGQVATTGYAYLPAGTYTVEFTSFSLLGLLSGTPYTLSAAVVSQPIGPQPVSSGGSSSGSSGSTSSGSGSQTATAPAKSGPTYYYY
jgi:hypothetical protein